jgi:hypothetical protein
MCFSSSDSANLGVVWCPIYKHHSWSRAYLPPMWGWEFFNLYLWKTYKLESLGSKAWITHFDNIISMASTRSTRPNPPLLFLTTLTIMGKPKPKVVFQQVVNLLDSFLSTSPHTNKVPKGWKKDIIHYDLSSNLWKFCCGPIPQFVLHFA